MRVLVTGGAGYIGSQTARWLLRSGHDVWVWDNLQTGHAAAAPADRLIVGDLRETERLAELLRARSIEGVLHFAANALVGESVQDPAKYYVNNVVGTLSLLEAMRQAAVTRIVFSSTAATYGMPDEMPITERARQAPINPYGFSKLCIEQALRDYAAAYQFGYAALRYFNAAGADASGEHGEHHRAETHLIPLTLQVALGQRPAITIFGDDYPTPDGTCVRDYVHIDDLAAAHLAALERLQPGRGIELNLGTGRGFSVREVVEACRRVTGHPIPVVLGPRRAGDPPVLVADATRARTELNWRPRFEDVTAIVASAWKWHQPHPRGYDA